VSSHSACSWCEHCSVGRPAEWRPPVIWQRNRVLPGG